MYIHTHTPSFGGKSRGFRRRFSQTQLISDPACVVFPDDTSLSQVIPLSRCHIFAEIHHEKAWGISLVDLEVWRFAFGSASNMLRKSSPSRPGTAVRSLMPAAFSFKAVCKAIEMAQAWHVDAPDSFLDAFPEANGERSSLPCDMSTKAVGKNRELQAYLPHKR